MDNKKHIEAVISKTFSVIKKVYELQKENQGKPKEASDSRIIFPQKRKNKETRVSEQELRFIFVEQLNKYLQSEEGKEWNVYYSVETPTEKEYGFSNPDKKESGNIDLVIHDSELKRIALIEFKANNPRQQSYQKDYEKLTNEPNGLFRYFLQIVENTKSNTAPNIERKIVEVKDAIVNRWGDKEVHFICHSLASEKPIIDKEIGK